MQGHRDAGGKKMCEGCLKHRLLLKFPDIMIIIGHWALWCCRPLALTGDRKQKLDF